MGGCMQLLAVQDFETLLPTLLGVLPQHHNDFSFLFKGKRARTGKGKREPTTRKGTWEGARTGARAAPAGARTRKGAGAWQGAPAAERRVGTWERTSEERWKRQAAQGPGQRPRPGQGQGTWKGERKTKAPVPTAAKVSVCWIRTWHFSWRCFSCGSRPWLMLITGEKSPVVRNFWGKR